MVATASAVPTRQGLKSPSSSESWAEFARIFVLEPPPTNRPIVQQQQQQQTAMSLHGPRRQSSNSTLNRSGSTNLSSTIEVSREEPWWRTLMSRNSSATLDELWLSGRFTGWDSSSYARVLGPTKRHTAAAIIIQKIWRGHSVRLSVLVHTKRQVGMPNLKKAKEHAQSLLPHDQVGSLLPLSCPVECFQVFGMGVYVYMRWMLLMKRVFVVAFLFSLAMAASFPRASATKLRSCGSM